MDNNVFSTENSHLIVGSSMDNNVFSMENSYLIPHNIQYYDVKGLADEEALPFVAMHNDVFPTEVSYSIPQSLQCCNVKGLVKEATPYLAYMDRQRVVHSLIPHWTNQLLRHFKDVAKGAKIYNAGDKSIPDWRTISKRLGNDKNPQKNVDIRTWFRLDINTYLVKGGFTFGLETVRTGTTHVWLTSQAPLLIYRFTYRVTNTLHRSFDARDQFAFDSYVFAPHQRYVIPEGERYVMVATQKTHFGVYVADVHATGSPWMKLLPLQRFAVPDLIPEPTMPEQQSMFIPELQDAFQPQILMEEKQTQTDPGVLPPLVRLPRMPAYDEALLDSAFCREQTIFAESEIQAFMRSICEETF